MTPSVHPLRRKSPGWPFWNLSRLRKPSLKSLRGNCDLIVLLSQLGESKDKKLARDNPQIDLILGGGGEARRAVIERVDKVLIYRLEPRGGYLGRIDYSLVDTKKPIKFLTSSERDEIEKRLERLITRSMQIKSEMAKSGKQEEMKVKGIEISGIETEGIGENPHCLRR